MSYGTGVRQSEQMQAWYNNKDDLLNDLKSISTFLRTGANAINVTAAQANNASNNVANLTEWRVNVSTLLGGALVMGLVYVGVKQLRRR